MEEEIQQLIEYLATKGFQIPDLYSDFRDGGLQHRVRHYKSFGEESMKYRLLFDWDHQFGTYRWTGYKATYRDINGEEKSRDFSPSYAGVAHADLAYHILSGRFEHIWEELLSSGISDYTDTNLNGFLETVLSGNPEKFTCKASKNEKEGLIDFEIEVSKQGRHYEASSILATFVRYPEIEHGIFNGVSSTELETRMAAIDWSRGDLYTMDSEGNPEPLPEIMEIINEVTRLLMDPKGREAGLTLQLQYWSEASYFDALIDDAAWDLYHMQPKIIFRFPLETGARNIYNLLCGRPGIAARPRDLTDDFSKWNLLVQAAGGLVIRTMEGPTRKELETYLAMLPLDDMHKNSLLTDLMRGEICTTTLYGLERKEVNISIDLPAKSLKISTLTGEIIPYNFRLEPTRQQQAPPAPQPGRQQNFLKKGRKRKGKGI